MNDSAADPSSADVPAQHERSPLRFELILASIWLGVGLFVLPAVIFGVGVAVLGPYGDGSKGLGSFYGDFFAGLAEPGGRPWLIALGPLIVISLLRAVFLVPRKEPYEDSAPQKAAQPAKRTPAEHSRIEPRIGSD